MERPIEGPTFAAQPRASVEFPAIEYLAGHKADEVIFIADHTIGRPSASLLDLACQKAFCFCRSARGAPTVVSQLLDDDHNKLSIDPDIHKRTKNFPYKYKNVSWVGKLQARQQHNGVKVDA